MPYKKVIFPKGLTGKLFSVKIDCQSRIGFCFFEVVVLLFCLFSVSVLF